MSIEINVDDSEILDEDINQIVSSQPLDSFSSNNLLEKPQYMSRDDVELLPKIYYGLIYLSGLIGLIIMIILTIILFENKRALQLFYKKTFIYLGISFMTWFNGVVLRDYFDVKVNYGRL